MNFKNITISILIGLFLVALALPGANAQYIDTAGDSQIYVNQPYNSAQQSNIMPPAGMAPEAAVNTAAGAAPYAAAPYAAPYAGNFAQQPYAYAAPYVGAPACEAPFGLAAAPCGPFTSGFTYSAQQASSCGPFAPPETFAAEQFYQFPGLTPYGAYPGAGYAAAGGVGLDPVTGYYGPYGGVTPLV